MPRRSCYAAAAGALPHHRLSVELTSGQSLLFSRFLRPCACLRLRPSPSRTRSLGGRERENALGLTGAATDSWAAVPTSLASIITMFTARPIAWRIDSTANLFISANRDFKARRSYVSSVPTVPTVPTAVVLRLASPLLGRLFVH